MTRALFLALAFLSLVGCNQDDSYGQERRFNHCLYNASGKGSHSLDAAAIEACNQATKRGVAQ